MDESSNQQYLHCPSVDELEKLGMEHLYGGKVRDIYAVNDEQLLMVASDRMSAYDVIMSEPIPEKGAVLNGISAFWFDNTKQIIDNHVVSCDITDFPFPQTGNLLSARSMLVTKTIPIRLEAIVRGYMFGHGYQEYIETGQVHGHHFENGIQLSEKLPNPIFTPTSKAEEGHDESVSVEEARDFIGSNIYDFIRDTSLAIYNYGANRSIESGILLADEVMTPDSSRYWEASTYEVGISPASFDKQYLRDWLETQPWDKTAPAPTLSPEVIAGTRERYVEAYERISGEVFSSWLNN